MKILHLSDIHFGRNYARTKITDPFEKRDEYEQFCQDLGVEPYKYYVDGMWKRYQKNNALRPIKQVKEVPPVGDVKEKCSFIVTADNQTYSIPMRVITVSEECDGKVSWCYLENNKEVSRKLKIECKVGHFSR